ncbi:trimeric intracellular cation channel family protein [Paenibacillus psychroresistens]|uniref:Trimeric intracellular cation channel family protein n=1 Tax=Paenibacillus psychroresistens TaxID=1778678 RepID=A0A6B8RW90_9BACL|nr:trimeric intracellular cation channel family protein [Paenibacillus psychroresistens]QGR00188.1 trimeric intracellular cation channel family protein [Paenibacillus psychroresistens]
MQLLDVFVYLGIVAAGISGALIGIKKHMDLFGVICLCIATSLGGGIVRDLLVGYVPPVAFIEPSYFFVSLTAGILTWIFYHKIDRIGYLILISDAIGLGVFTAVGSNTAISLYDNEPFLVVSMGLITGIGGGVLRDLFAQEIPYVFRKEIYAIASILGSISLILTYDLFPHMISLYICLGVTFSLRMVSVIYKLNFPVLASEKK